MKYLTLLLFCASAQAFEVESLDVKYNRFIDSYNPYVNNMTSRVSLDLRLNVYGVFFMDNEVHTETDDSQYRSIGWHYTAGAHITDDIDVYYEHHSQHVLDAAPPLHYQLEDSVGIRIRLLGKKNFDSLF